MGSLREQLTGTCSTECYRTTCWGELKAGWDKKGEIYFKNVTSSSARSKIKCLALGVQLTYLWMVDTE